MHAPFAWEAALCSRVGVTLSQLRFLIAMYLSVPLSLGPRWIGSRTGTGGLEEDPEPLIAERGLIDRFGSE